MISLDPQAITSNEQKRLLNVTSLRSSGSGSLEELIGMLGDPSWIVRRAVVAALASLGDSAIDALCDVLRLKRDNEARIAATVDALAASRGQPEPVLLRLIEDSDPAVITDALQVLGRRRSEASIPLMVKLTRHENDIVSVAAIEALGRVGGRSAVEALIELIGSGNFFRTFPAIDILGRSGDRRAIEPLGRLLSNASYLPEAARALGRSGDRAALSYLLPLLKSQTDSILRIAAIALWELRETIAERAGGNAAMMDEVLKSEIDSTVIRRLGRILPNLEGPEAIAVCNFLGTVRSAESAPFLVLKLAGAAGVGESAALALKRVGADSDLHVLQELREGDSLRRKILLPIISRSAAATDVAKCLEDPDPEVRALACETIARLGNTSVVALVYRLLEDSNLRVVHAATAALQSLGSRESRQLALKAAASDNPLVRRAAMRILAYFGDSESLKPLLDGISDPDPRVREVAVQGLPYLEDSRAYGALCETTKNSDPRLRAVAVRSLAHVSTADEHTYAILLKALSDADAWVRYYACQSLGRLAYSPASAEIAGLLDDEAGQVRVSAVEALSHLDSREAHRALQRAAASEEVDVQRAALTGLGIAHRIEDLPIVLAAAASEDVSTRLIAISAMVAFRSPLILGALSSAANDSDEQVRSAAIGFLASRAEAEATEVLVELLSKELTHERAKEALLIPQVNRVSGLLVALESVNDELAPVLISLISKIRRPDARRGLVSAMKLKNVSARKAAAAALAASPDPERICVLKEAAKNDPDGGVREICTLLLSE